MSVALRFDAAVSGFKDTIVGCVNAEIGCVREVVKPRGGNFAPIAGVFFGVVIPMVAIPMAAGEACRAFVKKPDGHHRLRTNLL